jgi:PAS domain-containing protein
MRDERRLRVFENRALRKIFGPKRDEVIGSGENYMRSLLICTHQQILIG